MNDSLPVSLRIFELLISGLYPEELYQAKTADLITSVPLVEKPVPRASMMTRVAVLAFFTGAAYLLMRKCKTCN